eukprot:Skav212433  [mRNA]  locus=scaffold1479:157740:165243:+ [translate_table: standard]
MPPAPPSPAPSAARSRPHSDRAEQRRRAEAAPVAPAAPRLDISVVFHEETTKEMTEIRAHSLVLMLASEFFQKMLTHEMKEKNNNQVHLPGKSPKEFQVLLKFLQPGAGRLEKISMENVGFLLKWAHEYCINSLETECVDFMNSQKILEENLDFLLNVAEDYSLDSLKSKCLEFIKTLKLTVPRVVRAHTVGLHDYVENGIQELLRDGVTDWTLCYDYPDLKHKVLERTLVAPVVLPKQRHEDSADAGAMFYCQLGTPVGMLKCRDCALPEQSPTSRQSAPSAPSVANATLPVHPVVPMDAEEEED